MTLSFTQTIKGKPNYFIHKIWRSILLKGLSVGDDDFVTYCYQVYFKKFGETVPMMDGLNVPPKLHTIREDKHSRWRPGMAIHMVVNNRTPNRFQFAPVIKCVSVQEIIIKQNHGKPSVYVEGKYIYEWDCEIENGYPALAKLAINDGFDSVEDFFAYFNKDFTGKIIHWTDLKY